MISPLSFGATPEKLAVYFINVAARSLRLTECQIIGSLQELSRLFVLLSLSLSLSQDEIVDNIVRDILIYRAGITCHARREFFAPNCNVFSVLNVNLNVTQTKQMTSLLFLNNLYPVMYRRVQKKQKATNYCIRFGHSVREPAARARGQHNDI